MALTRDIESIHRSKSSRYLAQQASTTLTCLEGLVIPRAKSMRRLSDTQKIREKSKIFRV